MSCQIDVADMSTHLKTLATIGDTATKTWLQDNMGLPLDISSSEVSHPTPSDLYTIQDLLQAARYGDLDDLTEILCHNFSANAQDSQGYSALHMAAANGHLHIIEYLIKNGADTNICNMEKNTPLHWAALNGYVQVVQELILHGANPSAVNRYDRTPLDEALSKGKQDVVNAIMIATAATALQSSQID